MVAFSQEVFDAICERIANGESLRAICKAKNMPSAEAVRKWLGADNDGPLVAQYARAREMQGDDHFDRVLDTALKVESGELDPQSARTVIDALKWTAGKLRPKVYGDKVAIGGADDLPPIKSQDMTAADVVAARLAAIKSRATGEPDAG